MIALLTTKTTHHIHFENEIYKQFKNLINISESTFVKPIFQTSVDFEKKREFFEKKIWFKNRKINFKSKGFSVKNINSEKVIKILKKNKIEFIIVFGTRKIDRKLTKMYKNKIFNLHGGNPEEYRGLDSHYWSIYHNNFNLYSCLHRLNYKLDDGDIIFLEKIKLKKNMKIFQLRLQNTICCIKMASKLINLIKRGSRISSFKQKKNGRYYSFMPRDLKKIVEDKFSKRI